MKHWVKIIALLIIFALASCGGGSGSGGSGLGDGDLGDGTLQDVGETISDALPGSIFYYTGSDTYETTFQLGTTVVVADSITVGEGYELENTAAFADEI